MKKRKKIITVAIDSPAAAGAGTQAKLISKHYNLFYLDTGKIYRFIAFLKIKYPKKFNYKFIKEKIKSLKIKDLLNKSLLTEEVGNEASVPTSSVNRILLERSLFFSDLIFNFKNLLLNCLGNFNFR